MKRHFPNWIRAYAEFTEYSESPEAFHFWTGISTIAGALRRRVWIDQRYFQWTPNFYIVLVGPPGIAAKSTSVRTGVALLEQVPEIRFGPQSMTWQALTQSLQDATMAVPFGNGEYLPMSCITCPVSELGTFLRPDDSELVDVLVSLWDGQRESWRRTTKTQGEIVIENPWINVIGCTTPSWLRANFPETMIGGGLTSRIVFVFGDKKRHLVPYPADVIPDSHFGDNTKRLVEDLCRIAELIGSYELDPKAKAWGVAWYEHHWTRRSDHMASDRYEGYIARKQTHIHKLAMVLAAASRDDLVIHEEDLVFANNMITSLETDMRRVFESIGVADTSKHVNEVLAYVRAYGGLSSGALWRHLLPVMSQKDFDDAITAAIKANFIRCVQTAGELKYYPVDPSKINDR